MSRSYCYSSSLKAHCGLIDKTNMKREVIERCLQRLSEYGGLYPRFPSLESDCYCCGCEPDIEYEGRWQEAIGYVLDDIILCEDCYNEPRLHNADDILNLDIESLTETIEKECDLCKEDRNCLTDGSISLCKTCRGLW